VRAIDRADNTDETPYTTIISGLNLSAPETTIVEKPPTQTNSRSAVFTFSGTDDITPAQFLEFECRLDTNDPELWLECLNPTLFSNLATGPHTIEVRAVDGNENIDPTPERYTWTIGPISSTDIPLNCDEANITLTSAADGWVDEVVPAENYLFMTELTVRSAAVGDPTAVPPEPVIGQNARALFRFTVPNDAAGCTLESATLRLYSSSSTEGRSLLAKPLATPASGIPWKESQLTWNSQPSPIAGYDPATGSSGDGFREFDVKAHVVAMQSGALANNGWVIQDASESDPEGGDQTFLSREMPQDPPDKSLPELVLRYAPAVLPPPPARDLPLVPRDDVQCGEVITESTLLTADVAGCLGEGIVIGKENIILDLGGKTVSSGLVLELGEEDGLLPGIRSGRSNVEIRGPGIVTGFGFGVMLTPGAIHSEVHGLTLSRNALAGVQLFDADNGRIGNRVYGNFVSENGESGIQLVSGTEGATVEANIFKSNGTSILLNDASNNIIRDNEISGIILDPLLDSDAGIVLGNGSRNNTLESNNVSDTGDAGIVVHQGSHGNTIDGGVLVRNGDAGVIVQDSDGTEIFDIVSHAQSDGGVVLSNAPGSKLQGSDLRFNPAGLEASGTIGLVVGGALPGQGNDASNSLQAGFGLGNGLGMTIVGNTANETGGSGISIEGGAFDTNGLPVGGATIEDNTTNQNAEHGLSVADGGHTIRGNNAHNNAGFGIIAGDEQTAGGTNIDGGGNKATGNGEFAECLGVTCDETGSVPIVPPDTAAPDTEILTGPEPMSASEDATFTFTATDTGPTATPITAMVFECRVDPPPDPAAETEIELEPPDPNPEPPDPPETLGWFECVSPHTFQGIEPGEHILEVRALDHANNFDPTPDTYGWEVHLGAEDPEAEAFPGIPPVTRLTAVPGELTELRDADANPMLDELGDPIVYLATTNRSATIRFVGSDNITAGYNLDFECRIHHVELDPFLEPIDIPGATEWESCESPKQYNLLAYGGHIVEVKAIDHAGNEGVPAWHSWWVHPPPPDTVPPDTFMESGPDPTTVLTTATFEFSGTDNQTPVEELDYKCSLDAGPFLDCTSPHLVNGLTAHPNHSLQVQAVDQTGNADSELPATYIWEVRPAPVATTVFCGQLISQSIRLNNSLGDCLGHGLIVNANKITIDLNGKTIDGKSIGAGILNNGFDSVTIKNGTLRDFDYGVALNTGSKLNIVENVTMDQNQEAGIAGGQASMPNDPNAPTVPEDPPPGVQSQVSDNSFRSNTIVGNARGIWLNNGAKDNLATGNVIGSTSGEAVFIDRATENRIEGNDIQVASKAGVLLEGAVDNVISGNAILDTGTGVLVSATTTGTTGIESTGNRIEGNIISDTGGPSLRINQSSDNELVDNSGSESNGYAIELYLADGNLVHGNDVSGNAGGISLKNSSGNQVEANNTSDSDSTGIILESQSFTNVLADNISSNNVGGGIYIGDETPAGQGTLVEGNTTSANNGMGIQASKPSHIFRDNVAMDNDNWGIYAGDPSNGRSNIDGGGNIAQNNKGPLGVDLKPQQCYNISCLGGPAAGDQIDPNTTILEGPFDPSTDDVAVFRFTGADNASPVTFECRLLAVSSTWQSCTSPATYSGLVDGVNHTFEVRALDFSGNFDESPATHAFAVDLGELAASIDSGPDNVTVSTDATFTFSASPSAGVTFECALDTGAFEACTSPHAVTSSSPAAPTEHLFQVRATNAASSTDVATYSWTIGPAPVAATVSCGEIITQSTRLLNDLVNCGGYGLIVGEDGITIDLDGHVVDGMGIDAGILNNGHDDVTITNGFVHEFGYGVQLNPGTARNVVSSVRVELSAIAGIALSDADEGGDGNTIRDNTVVGGEIGIALYSGTRHAVIRGNSLGANGGEGGILLEFASENFVEDNQIANTGGTGISMVGGGTNTVSENTVKQSGGFGIGAGDELIPSNGNIVERNTIQGGQGGILVGGDLNEVLNNTVTGSTGPGVVLELATNTDVIGNEFAGNAGGIALAQATDSLIEANNASGTLGSGIEVGELSWDNEIVRNTVSSNGGAGIEVTDSSIIGQGNVIAENAAEANGGDGIFVEGVEHVITENVALLNGGWGIYSVGGTDGGLNVATGNMEPDQCFGVTCTAAAIDIGAPETWLVSWPADVDADMAGVQANSRNASFTYMGSDGDTPITELVFECRIDSTNPLAWEDCEYPADALNLSPGAHVFEIRAVDMMGAGVADPTPARFEWTYVPLPSGVAPTAIIDLTPPAETWLPEAIFTFHSDEPDVTFQCRVDLGGWTPCGWEGASFMSQGAYEAAVEPTDIGLHTFYVRAIDFEGNVQDPATEFTWRLLGISVVFTDGPGFTPATGGPGGDPATGGPTLSSSAEITFVANVADAEFVCRVDGVLGDPFVPCTSPLRIGPDYFPLPGTAYPDPLLPGSHQVEVLASSETVAAGAELEAAVYEWEVVESLDEIPPDTTIELAPNADLSSTIFEFTGTDNLTPASLLQFECQVTNGTPATAPPNELDWVACVSPFNLLTEYTYEDPQLLLTEHTFYVRAIDLAEPEIPNPQNPDFAGNVDPSPAFYTWTPTEDTTVPSQPTLTGVANGAEVAELAVPFTFFATDNATPTLQLGYQCIVGSAPLDLGSPTAGWEPCSSPESVSGLDPGTYEFAVRAVDLMGNAGPPASRTFTIVAAPVVTILSGPFGQINPDTGVASLPLSSTESNVFIYRSDQPGTTFRCSLDGAPSVACNTPAGPAAEALYGLDVFGYDARLELSGDHTLEIAATNSLFVESAEPAVYEWRVELGPDVTAPTARITSGPANGTLDTVATFAFTGTDNRTLPAGLRFECALDSATAWNSCVSPQQFSDLTRGTHTLRVRAIDAAGNFVAPPLPSAACTLPVTGAGTCDTYTWIVAPPPIATITSGPGIDPDPGEQTSRTAAFEFESDVTGSTFQCWFDGAFNPGPAVDPADCLSGQEYTALGLGPHLFAVRAIDGFGNIGDWADAEFTVTPPVAQFVSVPLTSPDTSASFDFTSVPYDPDADFYCSLDGRPFAPCEPPKSYSNLWPGEHTFEVQTQYSGVAWTGDPVEFEPVPVLHTWTVQDFTAPVTTIDFGPPALTMSTSAYLGVSSNDPTATIECTLDAVLVDCEAGVIVELTELLPGPHTFTAFATDPSLNVGETVEYEWTIGTPTGDPNTPASDPAGTSVTVEFPGAPAMPTATVTFASVETAGITTLDELGGGPAMPEGYGGGTIYDLSTTALYSEPVTVCFTYDPLDFGGPTPSVRLLHFDGEVWIDITTVNNPIDFSPARICGLAEGFSLFAVALASGGMAPETSILSGPDGAPGLEGLPTSTGTTATFRFWADQPTALTQCSVDGDAWFFCASPYTVEQLEPGAHEFFVQAIGEFGWPDLTPSVYEWEVLAPPDTEEPETVITAGPPASTPNYISTFEFSGTDNQTPTLELDYVCILDGVDIGNCETPEIIEVTTAGSHTLAVAAIDAEGNVDSTPDSRTWTVVDMSPPETEIGTGPAEETTDTSATFTFEGFDPPVDAAADAFECALDNGDFETCTSPHTIPFLTGGTHVFHVRALDGATPPNIDGSPAFWAWSIIAPPDTEAPQTQISSHPPTGNSGPDVTFVFAASEPVEIFECALDQATPTIWEECSAVWVLTGLPSGTHTLWVRATDLAGNVDPTPAPETGGPFTWTTVGEPNTFMVSGPADPTDQYGATFVYSSNQDGVSFQCSVDGSAWGSCDPPPEDRPYVAGTPVSFQAGTPFLAGEDGAPEEHEFEVRAINQYLDADGAQVMDMTPATWTWTVQDATAPETVYLGMEEIDDPLAGIDPGLRFTFRGTDNLASSFVLEFECLIDNTLDTLDPEWETCGEIGVDDTFTHDVSFVELGGGSYTFQVRALDVVGNFDATPVPVPAETFVVEAEPETTIDLVTPDMGVDLQTDGTTVTFDFSSDTGVSFECAFDAASFTACTSGFEYTDVPYGTHLFRVQAVAPLGTRDLSPAEFAWESGYLVAPDVTIDTGPTTGTDSSEATFTFSSTDTTASFQCTLDGLAIAPCVSPKTLTGVLAGATHTFEVTATKANLLAEPLTATYEWDIVDTAPPETSLVPPLPPDPSGTEVAFSFTGTDNGTLPADLDFECSLDGAEFAACTSGAPITIETGGMHIFEVRAVDAMLLADASPESYAWQVVTPPATEITSAPPALSLSPDATFTFFDQLDSTYECRLDPTQDPELGWTECFGAGTTYVDLSNGPHVFEVRATTLLGVVEEPVAFGWTVNAPDTTPPSTSIVLGPASPTASTSATFIFGGSDNLTALADLTYECRLDSTDDLDWEACGDSWIELTGLSAASHTLDVRATDLDGNVDPTPVSYPWTVVTGTPNTAVGAPSSATGLGAGISLTFSDVTSAGVTEVSVLTSSPELPSPYSDTDALFFDAWTDAGLGLNATIEICLPYNTALLEEPHLIHFEDGAWVDVTTSLDEINGIVCGIVSSLSPFAVAEAPGVSPQTTIAQSPAAETLETQVGGAAVQFQFTSTAAGSPDAFECSVDDGPFSSCVTPYAFIAGLGEHTLLVRGVSVDGDFDLTPASHTWTVLARPVVTDLTGPADELPETPNDIESGSSMATFTFGSSQPDSTFECQLSSDEAVSSPWATCASGREYTGLTVGSYTFQIRVTNGLGHTSLDPPVQYEWEVADLTAPVTTILSGPDSPTAETTATFTYTVSEPATLECWIDGLPVACASALTYTNVQPGTHTFEVQATDLSEQQNVGAPASYTWTVDTSAPEAEFTGFGSGSIVFNFTGTDDNTAPEDLVFECSLDSAPYSTCTSPTTVSFAGLSAGNHTFDVRATDEAGNTGLPASHTFFVPDTTAPQTTITGQPAAETTSTSASFSFGATDDFSATGALTYACSVDGIAFGPCFSPQAYSGLAVGSHTFRVKASDEAGNTDDTPATYTWTVLDSTAPDTEITNGPPASTISTTATFTFTGSDDVTAAGALTFQCSLDGAAFAACTSPQPYSGLSVGAHTFQVKATDGAGLSDSSPASYSWTVLDSTAPETTITSQPAASTIATTASFSFTGSDSVSAPAALTFQCSLDGAAFAACTSPQPYSGLSVGSHTFEVKATDAAGNTDATPATHTWTVVDSIAPETTIATQPPATTPDTTATFTFTGSDDVTAPGALTFQCSLDGGAFAGCESPKVYSGLNAGSHTFQVRASDARGNTDASPASYSWAIDDTTAPDTIITGQPPATTTNTSTSFAFTGSDDLTVAGALTFECSLDGAAFSDCTSPQPYSGLADGSHTFQVQATDLAGHTDATPASYTWTVEIPADTTAPETTIATQPPATTTLTTASFTFTSSETPSTFQCSLDGAAFTSCSTPVDLSGLSIATHTFQVKATDTAGNTDATPASYSWTVQSAVNCGSAQTLTATTDSWIDQASPTSNKGSDSILKVMSKSGNGNLRALVRFTLPTMPQGCSVEYATLRIYAKSAATGRTLQAHYLSGSWSENGVTWSNQPGTSGSPVTTTSGTGYREWNAAGLVQGMYTGANNGFLIRDANESSSDAEQQFHSRSESTNRPQLVLKLWNGAPPATPNGAPDTQITGSPLAATPSTSATFTFSGNDDVTPAGSLTFQCQLDVADTAPWTACTSAASYSGLADGSHIFRVRAVDGSGNVDPQPAVYTWTVDQVAPETVIGNGPGATTTSTSATFTFVSPETGSTFTCSLDTAPFTACVTGLTYTDLALGAHTFQVKATDAAGNVDGSPASYSWTINPGAPVDCGPAQTMSSVADAWLEQSSPSSNKGDDGILKVMSKSGNANTRAVVRFNLPAIPSGCVLQSASLRLYAASESSSVRTLHALRLNASWTETGITWGNQPATAGSSATTTSGTGYRQWAVQSIVQAMYSSGLNNGFLIKDGTENADAEQQFHAREKGDNPPQLVLTFAPSP
jgi:parallel beta-helix repeat protein